MTAESLEDLRLEIVELNKHMNRIATALEKLSDGRIQSLAERIARLEERTRTMKP